MKKLFWVSIILAFAIFFEVACSNKTAANQANVKKYELRGKVLEIDSKDKKIKVEHEDIKGFMDAMTMRFSVRDETGLAKVAVGDQITATLVYNPNDNRSWLEELTINKSSSMPEKK